MMSLLVGPTGQVHAFEPARDTFNSLVRNLALNDCANVVPVKVAVSDVPGELLLRKDPQHPTADGHSFVQSLEGSSSLIESDEIVRAVTLDGFDGLSASFNAIDLMVIDVEGAEHAVLMGARRMLSQGNPTLLLECSQNQVDVERLLRQLGFSFWAWNVKQRKLEAVDFYEAVQKGDVIVRRDGWALT
jgi:FkbM family methyltransferase